MFYSEKHPFYPRNFACIVLFSIGNYSTWEVFNSINYQRTFAQNMPLYILSKYKDHLNRRSQARQVKRIWQKELLLIDATSKCWCYHDLRSSSVKFFLEYPKNRHSAAMGKQKWRPGNIIMQLSEPDNWKNTISLKFNVPSPRQFLEIKYFSLHSQSNL